MYSILTEELPSEYQGYLIRTDYRVGIKIMQKLQDYNIEESERNLDALMMLYGNGIPDDILVAMNGLLWFLSGGTKALGDDGKEYVSMEDIGGEVVEQTSDSTERMYDFDYDSKLIWSCFLSQYGVDITQTNMHWFKFLAMFSGLKDTIMNDVMYYRTADLGEIKNDKERVRIQKLKSIWRVRGIPMPPELKARYKLLYVNEWKKYAREHGYDVSDED